MDWMEHQILPLSWHDEGEIIPNNPGDESFCPLTSMVRRCYLKHLEQTLIQNYESCRTNTIQHSTLRDFILHWEQNALRACMMTAVYQRAMLQVINAIKSDTKQKRLASVLSTSIKKLKSRFSNAATQTDTVTPSEKDPSELHSRTTKSYPAFSTVRKTARESSLNKESSVGSSDGPFLTPPFDYPSANVHTMKNCHISRREPTFVTQSAPVEQNPSNPSFQMPIQFLVPPPGYPPLPPDTYSSQVPNVNWACKSENGFMPFSLQTSTVNNCDANYTFGMPTSQETAVTLNEHNPHTLTDAEKSKASNYHCMGVKLAHSMPSQTEDDLLYQMQTCETERIPDTHTPPGQISCKAERSLHYMNPEFPLDFSDIPEPDYNWDQIEEEMARLCGQVFTESDNHMDEKPEEHPHEKSVSLPISVSEPPDNWEVLGALHEEELKYRLDQLRQKWSLEKQANLKRKFIEFFGRDMNEDEPSTQPSAKEAAKCKQRIAPWVVKHLMPLYKQKRILSRHVFKSLAKHIADLLIQRNLYPDECDVWMAVQEFFGSGITISCEADFCA